MDGQQDSIFDTSFVEAGALPRRRAIIPLALKIYVWFGMIAGGLIAVSFLIQLLTSEKILNHSNDATVFIASFIFAILNALLLFLMNFFIWMEVKWALALAG